MSMKVKTKVLSGLQLQSISPWIFIIESQYATSVKKHGSLDESVSISPPTPPMATRDWMPDLQGTPTVQKTYHRMKG
ncbi:hypothetical protein Tco_0754234 [Tanacetum coccineum]